MLTFPKPWFACYSFTNLTLFESIQSSYHHFHRSEIITNNIRCDRGIGKTIVLDLSTGLDIVDYIIALQCYTTFNLLGKAAQIGSTFNQNHSITQNKFLTPTPIPLILPQASILETLLYYNCSSWLSHLPNKATDSIWILMTPIDISWLTTNKRKLLVWFQVLDDISCNRI